MRFRALLPAMILGACCAAWAQSPTYGVGKKPTPEEIRAWDITISPDGENLPVGSGTAKEGALLFAQKCAVCHGATGSGGPAPMLIKPEVPVKSSMPCLAPCIGPGNVMALHSPFATTMWDYINRAMPFDHPSTLTPDEVYSATAYVLFLNGIVGEQDVLDETTLPKVQMPNRNGFVSDPRPDVPLKRK